MGMASQKLILVSNPGSASRKYGLYRAGEPLAELHFEHQDGCIVCTSDVADARTSHPVDIRELSDVSALVLPELQAAGVLQAGDAIDAIAVRVVAPSAYFLENRLLDAEAIGRLESLAAVAPLHITATLAEVRSLSAQFPGKPIIGISDSRMHATKPAYAWNYGISLEEADTHDIKRFGYHGISVCSAVRRLRDAEKLANKVVLVHLGSGASVTALHGGKSLDNTMGYSPLEGLVMASRSGSIDFSAAKALQEVRSADAAGMEAYLNKESGLLGLGGSSDIRELLQWESAGNQRAALALQTYVYSVQKGIAQMTAALGGIDALVFTGTVGERSATIRHRVIDRLHYLDLLIDERTNKPCQQPTEVTVISRLARSKPIYVVPTEEATEIAHQTADFLRG